MAKLAVKSTHSKSCPILWRNSSTCGRFSTYTCGGRRQELSVIAARDSQGLGRAVQGPCSCCQTYAPCTEARTRFCVSVQTTPQREREADHTPRVLRIFGASKRSTAVPCPVEVTHSPVCYPWHLLSQPLCGHRPQGRCCPSGSLGLAAAFSPEWPHPLGLMHLKTFQWTPWRSPCLCRSIESASP